MIREAHGFAVGAHAGRRQESDGSPYIEHPVRVARLLQLAGFRDEVVAAGLLHDTVEGSDYIRVEDVERRFGRPVATLVAVMTEPDGPRDFATRKAAHRRQVADAGGEAAAVFAADKIANLQNLRHAIERHGERRVRRRLSKPLDRKVEHYRKTLEMLDALGLARSLAPLLAGELAGLEAVRSRCAEVPR